MRSLVLVGAACLAACGAPKPAGPSLEEDLAAIAAFNERYLKAINDEDIATLASLTTEGHIMLAPNRAPIVGKRANDELNGAAFERFDFTESWTPEETVISGDLGYQRGTFTTVAAPRDGGASRTVNGNFLRIYRRQPNGEWRMVRDMWSADGSAAN
jgi:ketosteroid isomerase-like protein